MPHLQTKISKKAYGFGKLILLLVNDIHIWMEPDGGSRAMSGMNINITLHNMDKNMIRNFTNAKQRSGDFTPNC